MEHDHVKRGRLTSAADMFTFALAGNATLTLVSEKTKTRYTFKVRRPDDAEPGCPFFVSVMYGSDNEDEFAYLGTIGADGQSYRHGKKSHFHDDDVRHLAFKYFWSNVVGAREPPSMEVWHEGRCCKCGRKLTVPESIANGIGPECKRKVIHREHPMLPLN